MVTPSAVVPVNVTALGISLTLPTEADRATPGGRIDLHIEASRDNWATAKRLVSAGWMSGVLEEDGTTMGPPAIGVRTDVLDWIGAELRAAVELSRRYRVGATLTVDTL